MILFLLIFFLIHREFKENQFETIARDQVVSDIKQFLIREGDPKHINTLAYLSCSAGMELNLMMEKLRSDIEQIKKEEEIDTKLHRIDLKRFNPRLFTNNPK